MSISSTSRKTALFTGNGATTSYPFTFKVQASADIAVYLVEDDVIETVPAADYTVTLNGNQNSNPGGSVVFDTAPTVDQSFVITTEAGATQSVSLQNQGAFNPTVISEALDKLTILYQQVAEKVGRALKLRITSSATNDALPEPENSKVLGWASGWTWVSTFTGDLVSSFMQAPLMAASAHAFAKLTDGVLTLQTYAAFQALTGHAANVTYRILGRVAAGDGGGGDFRWVAGDQSALVTADPGFGHILPPAAATSGASGVGRRVAPANYGVAQWFGIFTTAADNSTANGHVTTWSNATAAAPHFYYPPGNYLATTPVTWSRSRARIECAPGVTFTGLGADYAMRLDGGAAGYMVGAALLGWPRCRTHATSGKEAVYIRSYHHGTLQFVVDGCDTTKSGWILEFGVCPLFDNVQVCKNEDGDTWYNSGTGAAIPLYSGTITRRANGDQAGYACLVNPVFEDGVNGLLCDYQVGAVIYGGTMENFSAIGFVDTANSRNVRMFGTDFEANATRDIDISGYGNEFHGVDSELEIKFRSGAFMNKIIGGAYKNVVVDSGALYTSGIGFTYDRFASGGTLSDAGTNSSWHGIFKRDATTPMFRSGDPTETTVNPTAGGANYSYTNSTGNNMRVRKIGGTVSTVTINGNDAGATAGQFLLAPGDVFAMTNVTVAPVLKYSGC